MRTIMFFILFAGVYLFQIGEISAQYKIPYMVFAGGAGTTVRDSYRLNVTIGQPITGKIENTTYNLTLGYVSAEDIITSVTQQPSERPGAFQLFQNYPNPFNPSTTIMYQLQKKGYVTLRVFDVLGREIMTLVDEIEEPGYNSVTLNAGTLASGVYFYRLHAGSHTETKKLILMK